MKAKGSSFGVGCIYIIYTLWFLLMSIDHDKGFFGDSLLFNIFVVSFVFAIYLIPTLILGERTRFAQGYPSIVRSLEFWLLFFIATAAPKPLSIERIHEIYPNIGQISELIVIGIRSFVSWFSVAFLGTQILMLIKKHNSESSSGNDPDSETVKEEKQIMPPDMSGTAVQGQAVVPSSPRRRDSMGTQSISISTDTGCTTLELERLFSRSDTE